MKLTKLEKLFCFLFFLLIWSYLWLRGDLVFYVHDEIVSKWSYMIDWNFKPYQGYIDANNHFLNSFLGGLFLRLFHSDHILIIRLGSLLAFPLYFASLYSLKSIFRHKWPFYLLLISCCTTQFLLDFFSLARGYALAWALFIAAISSCIHFNESKKPLWGLSSLAFWLLSAYANLSFLPTICIGIVLIAWIGFQSKQFKHLLLPLLLSIAGFLYLLSYAFELQSMGKLYLGSADHFFATAIHPITTYLFNISNWWLDALLLLISLAIAAALLRSLVQLKSLKSEFIFSLFFILSLVAVLLQNSILGINYPEDRGVGYLLLLFFAALAFSLDRSKLAYAAIPLLLLFAITFIGKANLSHTLVYDYEHFDEQLLNLIPEETEGIPTSTGGRFWAIDNEMSRSGKMPARAFQNSPKPKDTLVDYIITLKKLRRNLPSMYEAIYEDSISSLTLFKRKQFLKRKKLEAKLTAFDNQNEFVELYSELISDALFVQIQGGVRNASLFEDYSILVTAENEDSKERYFYQGFGPVSTAHSDPDGNISFDLSYALNRYSENTRVKIYIYNPKHYNIKGEIEVIAYKIL